MKNHFPKAILYWFLVLLAVASEPPAYGALYQWSIQNGEEDRRVYLWIPEDCTRIRGLVMAMKNLNEPGIIGNPAFREACRQERIGIVFVGDAWARSALGSDWGWRSGLSKEDEKEYSRLEKLLKTAGTTPEQAKEAKEKIETWDKELTSKAGLVLDDILKRLAEESGYEEVSRTPLLILSHSMGGLICWHMPYWIPERMWGSMPIKTGMRIQPAVLPDSNMHGVPVLYMNWADPFGPNGPDSPNKFPLLARKDTDNLVGQVFDWGGTHFDMTDEMAKLAAMFVTKASHYRLSDEIPAEGYPKLKNLQPDQGWLATSPAEPEQYPMAPEGQYAGPKEKALWYFDEEMAKAAIGHHLAEARKKPQYVTIVSNGETLQPTFQHFDEIQIPQGTALDDGLTYSLVGAFLDKVPSKDPAKAVPTGHSPTSKIAVKLTGGNALVPLDENTFRYRKFNDGKHGWVVASAPGDAEYARANYQALIPTPDNRNGTIQTITFPEIADVPAGTKEIEMQATSDVPGQVVEYYVVSGPAEFVSKDPKYTGSTLRFTPIPPNAKYPVKVIVAAYQPGRSIEPLVKAAPEVVREFQITKP
jgi:hypothetical protein